MEVINIRDPRSGNATANLRGRASVFDIPVDLARCVLFPMLTLRELGNLSGVNHSFRNFILNGHAKRLCDDLGAWSLVEESAMSPLELLDMWFEQPYALSCGENHGAMLSPSGTLLLWQEHAQRTPVALPDTTKVKAVSCGHGHTLILSINGQVYASGLNDHGQLGLADRNNRDVVELVPMSESVIDIKAGNGFSLFLTSSNRLLWSGTLNIASSAEGSEVLVPTEVIFKHKAANEKIKQIAAGALHVLVLTSLGRLYSAGDPQHNRLGRIISPEEPPYELHHVSINKRPEASIVQISAGATHSLILFANGEVFTFGQSSSGELGLPRFMDALSAQPIPNLPKALAVSAGIHHSLILAATKNKIVAFGMGALGQLGYRVSFWSSSYPRDSSLPQDECKRIKYVSAGNGFSACLSGDGADLFACGKSSMCAGAGSGVKSGTVLPVFTRVPED